MSWCRNSCVFLGIWGLLAYLSAPVWALQSSKQVYNSPGASSYAGYHSPQGLACGAVGPNADSCPGFDSCGGDGRPGICGCTPRAIFPALACGIYPDDCGGFRDFGGCAAGQTCGGGGTCKTVSTPENITCGATLQSNKTYKFTGGSSSGTCFTIAGSVNNIIIDGDGQTLTAATAFQINDGAQEIVIKNFVIDAAGGITFGSAHREFVSNCAGLAQNIRVQSNRFIRGGLQRNSSGGDDYAVCNLRINGNRFENGGISLGFYNFNPGIGGHVIVDNVIERRPSTSTAFNLSKIDGALVLHNTIRHLVNLSTLQHVAVIDNRFDVTEAIGGSDNNGKSMLEMVAFRRGVFAGNFVRNQESTPSSGYQMAMNTYTSQSAEYLWNTIIQQLPSPYPQDQQVGINFRSAPTDNFLYRNYVRAYNGGGYAIKTLAANASGTCVVNADTGALGSCNARKFVIDSNIAISNLHSLYLADSESLLVRNNVLAGASTPVNGCGSPANRFIHNLIDSNGGGSFQGGSCTESFNNLIYSSTMGSWFRNRPAFDYHLLAGAGAINQVAVNALAPSDFEGISRPFGGNADSGPFEFINDSQDPTTPASVRASALSWSRVRLTWDPAFDNDSVSHYNVYVFSGGSFVLLKSVPDPIAFDLGLSPSTQYRYKVSSVDRSGRESALSTEVAATTAGGPFDLPPADTLAPAAPTSLRTQ